MTWSMCAVIEAEYFVQGWAEGAQRNGHRAVVDPGCKAVEVNPVVAER